MAQVITYTRNALGNSKGDEIQPKAIQALLPEGSSKVQGEQKATVTPKSDAGVKLSMNELLVKGKTVYADSCASCHQADGAGLAGTFPAITASKMVKGDINKQVELMMKGKGMMPAFGTMLDAVDFAAVVTYTRNALGNKVGDLIQPTAIQSVMTKNKAE